MGDLSHRRRECLVCKKVFYPRTTQISAGQGKYCSNSCSAKDRKLWEHSPLYSKHAAMSEEERKEYKRKYHREYFHKVKHKYKERLGEWRRANREKINAGIRDYFRRNPGKSREKNQRRHHKISLNKLPKGTVIGLYEKQKGKCAVCKIAVADKYHIDHIIALSNGGKHEKENLQILCPPCNLKKASQDPIVFMQKSGYLL